MANHELGRSSERMEPENWRRKGITNKIAKQEGKRKGMIVTSEKKPKAPAVGENRKKNTR